MIWRFPIPPRRPIVNMGQEITSALTCIDKDTLRIHGGRRQTLPTKTSTKTRDDDDEEGHGWCWRRGSLRKNKESVEILTLQMMSTTETHKKMKISNKRSLKQKVSLDKTLPSTIVYLT
ncbi:hypothetical protein H0E87_031605, partial [Populus deltoides]